MNSNNWEQLLSALTETMSTQDLQLSVIQSDLATALIRRRSALGMTQTQFAEFLGVKQSQVSKWEKGEINFTLSKLVQIAGSLDLNLTVKLGSSHSIVSNEYRTKKGNNILYLHKYLTSRTSGTDYTNDKYCSVGFSLNESEELKEM